LKPAAWIFVTLVSLLLAWRLFSLINFYAVNILMMDQWDYYDALFNKTSLWDTFRWQHGTPRLGVGLLLTKAVAELSGWNTRAEALSIGVIVCAAMIAAFRLKNRLFGAITWSDVIVPLIFLTPAQYGTFLDTPDPAHSAVPLLLLVLYCLGWMMRATLLRYSAVLVLNFLCVYTGFGLFVGVITPALLAVDAYHAHRKGRSRDLRLAVASLAISLLCGASFFVDYRFFNDSAFNFLVTAAPAPSWRDQHLQFTALLFSNFLGLRGVGAIPSVTGCLVFLLLVLSSLHNARRLLGRHGPLLDTRRTIFILSAFSILFSIFVSLGRSHLGLGAAQWSRYATLLIPAFLGMYFQILVLSSPKARNALLVVTTAALIAVSFPLRKNDLNRMSKLSYEKETWKDIYLRTESIEQATALAGLSIYPYPEGTKLKEKLDYLKKRRLNLYLDAPPD
jgi:hypothetical protein